MSDAVIIAHGLRKTFGGTVMALDGLDLQVEAGTVLGLLGPNGAGKTTAVRILSTILLPDSGHAEIMGHDVVREADTVRRLIGLAGQSATVDEYLTARENLRMVGRLNHMARGTITERADELLDHFGLLDAADRQLRTYSGGMRRRLDVAAALVARPPVLFLDEPTTGLDPSSRQDLWRVIEELVSSGATVLLTTQYLEEADRLADRIAVVDHGTVIAEGTAAELKASLGSTVLAVTMPDNDTARRAAGVVSPFGNRPAHVDGAVVELTVSDGARITTEVLRALDGQDIPIAGLTLREPSLDDVFLNLTGHRAEVSADESEPGSDARGDRGEPKVVPA